MPDRLITDSTTIAYEMLHQMQNRRRGKVGHMAMKLVISEAYDHLKIGLSKQWVNLAMELVITPTYSVFINGEPKWFISLSSGIRQGDPLFSYLFLLCAKGLSSLLQKAKETHQINGISSYKGGVQISHLLFADDSLLLCEAKTTNCQNLLKILAQYEEASGQAINQQKTFLFFSHNTQLEDMEAIQGMLGAQIMTDCEKYLGLSMVGGKSRVSTFKDIQERISNRVMSWKEKFISKAGREVLIVAQVIPTYSMSIFKIPKTICDGINLVLAKYWWGQKKKKKIVGLIGVSCTL